MNWVDYVLKKEVADEDDFMIGDNEKEVNKRLTFTTLWEWVAKKLANTQVDSVKSEDKTVIGTLNQKANGEGITFSINESGGVEVTYDDGEE